MAASPAHKLGQIIGDQFEAAIRRPLESIADEFGLYLDFTHPRQVRERRKKVSWKDLHGNVHDMDYVLEEGGTDSAIGHPRAFIETAWRRYTKHSRNKAQEIQGAVLPLTERYHYLSPFFGAALAGVFTEGAISQLKSLGFQVAYFPYGAVVNAFRKTGLDIAFDEETSEVELQMKVDAFERMSVAERNRIPLEILAVGESEFSPFFNALRASLQRSIREIVVLTLYGAPECFDTILQAVEFISSHDEASLASSFVRYEVVIRYSNGDEIKGAFQSKGSAVGFLQKL
ncbi:MAG: DNA methylase [Chloroflexi bacterium]|nr:DNA methylase [Chloroflexota bacterium]